MNYELVRKEITRTREFYLQTHTCPECGELGHIDETLTIGGIPRREDFECECGCQWSCFYKEKEE